MDRVSSIGGLSPYCGWKLESDKFEPSDSLEVRQCCKNGCNNRSRYCSKIGGSPRKCQEALSICQSACDEIPSKGIDTVTNCAVYYGCDTLDPWCIKKNSAEILNCCRQRIDLGNDTNCQKFIDHLSSEKIEISDMFPFVNLGSRDRSANFIVILSGILAVVGTFMLLFNSRV